MSSTSVSVTFRQLLEGFLLTLDLLKHIRHKFLGGTSGTTCVVMVAVTALSFIWTKTTSKASKTNKELQFFAWWAEQGLYCSSGRTGLFLVFRGAISPKKRRQSGA